MADATSTTTPTPPAQIVKISAEIKLSANPFTNAPVLTAIGAAVKTAQDQIAQSGADTTKDFQFTVVAEAEKAPRQPRAPKPAATPAPAAAVPAAAAPAPATAKA